jgi:hypothetical protein
VKAHPDLFDYTPPPYRGEPPAQRHSQTSKAAAAQIKKAIGPLHKLILAHLKDNPSTDEEIMSALDMNGNTERPRRRELELMGKIEDSGKTRLTRSGRTAVVWRIAS